MKVIIEVEDSIYRDEYYVEKHSGVGIKKEFCQIVDDNIRLTEEQARELLDDAVPLRSYLEVTEKIESWKAKGWIIETKTAKEEFEEYYKRKTQNATGKYEFDELYNLAQKAIKEAEEK